MSSTSNITMRRKRSSPTKIEEIDNNNNYSHQNQFPKGTVRQSLYYLENVLKSRSCLSIEEHESLSKRIDNIHNKEIQAEWKPTKHRIDRHNSFIKSHHFNRPFLNNMFFVDLNLVHSTQEDEEEDEEQEEEEQEDEDEEKSEDDSSENDTNEKKEESDDDNESDHDDTKTEKEKENDRDAPNEAKESSNNNSMSLNDENQTNFSHTDNMTDGGGDDDDDDDTKENTESSIAKELEDMGISRSIIQKEKEKEDMDDDADIIPTAGINAIDELIRLLDNDNNNDEVETSRPFSLFSNQIPLLNPISIQREPLIPTASSSSSLSLPHPLPIVGSATSLSVTSISTEQQQQQVQFPTWPTHFNNNNNRVLFSPTRFVMD